MEHFFEKYMHGLLNNNVAPCLSTQLGKILSVLFSKKSLASQLGHPSPIYMNNQPLGNGLRFL